jgi:hypothetical protein
MGAIQTGIIKDNNCQYEMNIYLEKMNYFPGETILGLLQITSNYIINKKLITSSKISFTLKEIQYWQNRQNNKSDQSALTPQPSDNYATQKEGEHPDDKKHYFESIILLKEDLILNIINLSENGENSDKVIILSKKEIKIPINIEIPKDIKPSLEWTKDNNTYCYSRILLSISIPDLKLFSNYFLFVHKKAPLSISTINIEKIIGNKSIIFFWDNDYIKIEASSQRDSYPFSDLFPFEIRIDTSQLKTRLNSIIITLKRKVKFLVNGEQSIFLNTCDFIDDLWENKIILEKNETNHYFEFKIPLIDNDKILNQKKFNFNFNIKNFNKKFLTYIIPSFSGEMIKCEYFIKIKPMFEGANISYSDILIYFDLFHNQNIFSLTAIKEINKILYEINKMQRINYNDINNCSAYSSSVQQSLPDEDMIKKYYSSNRGVPPNINNI